MQTWTDKYRERSDAHLTPTLYVLQRCLKYTQHNSALLFVQLSCYRYHNILLSQADLLLPLHLLLVLLRLLLLCFLLIFSIHCNISCYSRPGPTYNSQP